LTTALAAPSPLRHGEVALLPLDATAPALASATLTPPEAVSMTCSKALLVEPALPASPA